MPRRRPAFFDDCAIVALISTWMLYQLARFIELKLPFLIPYALKLAPVTFLTFAGHTPIYYLLLHSPWGHSRALAFTLPILVFILMASLFFTLKHWCRPLLHLVAHYKLRPDDYPPPHHQRNHRTTRPTLVLFQDIGYKKVSGHRLQKFQDIGNTFG